MSDLLKNLEKIHTTEMGLDRISKNLDLPSHNVVEWCKTAITMADLIIVQGKNWYVYFKGVAITVNAKSYTIITAHKISGKVREMKESDYPCLNEFLYQAIHISEGAAIPARDIVNLPEIHNYIKDFGKQKGDLGVVAEQNGQIIGAAWTRIIAAYGHIDNNTPELVISILPEFRGCGIGTKLMKNLFKLLQTNGYKQTSLLVQKDNPAVAFYQKFDFKIVDEKVDGAEHEDYVMLKSLVATEI